MDVNGLPMWLIAGPGGFGLMPGGPAHGMATGLALSDSGHLVLASAQDVPSPEEVPAYARLMASQPAPVADEAGTFAWWDGSARTVQVAGFAPGAEALPLPDFGATAPTALALGTDQILYIAHQGRVIMADLRSRYPIHFVELKQFSADLLAPHPQGGVWAMDRTRRTLARLRGYPLRPLAAREPAADRFEPASLNSRPPRLRRIASARLSADLAPVSLAASPSGQLALLAWEAGKAAQILLLAPREFGQQQWEPLGRTAGLAFPWSLAWHSAKHGAAHGETHGETQLAVMASDGEKPAQQAWTYAADRPARVAQPMAPLGRILLLRNPWPQGFANSLGPAARYLSCPALGSRAATLADVPELVRPLLALSGVRHARTGTVLIGPIDSGAQATVWHRIYADAALPPQARIRIHAYASDQSAVPLLPRMADAPAWAAHAMGGAREPGVPQAAWCDAESEVAGAASLLACPQQPDRAGLFTLLLQHHETRVRRISGRYLWLALELEGDSQSTPELAALRIYANRLSYRDAYLPDFYGEALNGDDARLAGPATPQDFLERFLGLFEGPLTEMEGRIAGAWRLTDPATAPDAALPWIGQWIGISPHSSEAPAALRQRLITAPCAAALHGTLGGLMLALELATGGMSVRGGQVDADDPPSRIGTLVQVRVDGLITRALLIGIDHRGQATIVLGGAVTRGDIVIVEGFRLRRTFATILGARLADADDPLTLGMATSGNSFVGDTLILGEEARAELMALYRQDADFARGSAAAVTSFFERLAHRVLILVRNRDSADMARLGEICAETCPAHVEPQLFAASSPLIVGAASLVGVDTYLMDAPPVQRVRLDRSLVGRGDLIMGEGWLDGRADGPLSPPPFARSAGPATTPSTASFTLSAAGSRAARGLNISQYVWTWEGPAGR